MKTSQNPYPCHTLFELKLNQYHFFMFVDEVRWPPAMHHAEERSLTQVARPAHHGTRPTCCQNQTSRTWNQVEPSRNQARMLQIARPAHHGTKPTSRQNQAFRTWNQVEPSRNQARMLQIVDPAHYGFKWNQVEPSSEPSQIPTLLMRKPYFWSVHRLLIIILYKERCEPRGSSPNITTRTF